MKRALFLLPLTGCLTTSVLQTAETAGKDNFQFAFEPGVVGVGGAGGGGYLPSINIAGRYGLSDRVDIGGRFGTTLIEMHVKAMLTEPNPDELQISIAPHVGGFALGSGGTRAGIFWVKAPLLIDVPLGHHDLILGPGVRMIGVSGGGDGGSGVGAVFLAGSTIGFGARIGNRARIIPEFGLEYPIVGTASFGGEGGTTSLGDGVVFSFQVGFVFGGRARDAGTDE